MDYLEVSIAVEPFTEDAADWITAEIADLGFESFETEGSCLKAYIPRERFNEAHLKAVLSGFASAPFRVSHSLRLIPEQNWNAVWEASFEPVVVEAANGCRCTVKATFHRGLPRTKYTVRIDPKMAFGTGHHQTTALMVQALMEEPVRDRQVLDMGCGTGILSILAAKMKARVPVHAIDVDPTAVLSARENARLNRVADRIRTLCGDASLLQAGKYDLILANINRNILLQDMSTYARSLTPGGVLFLSGFYAEDVPMLEAEASCHGLERIREWQKDAWSALKFVKNS